MQKNESLSAIAGQAYGDPARYTLIYETNAKVVGRDPSRIRVGMRLFVPCEVAPPAPPVTTPSVTQAAEDWQVSLAPRDLSRLLDSRNVQLIDIRPNPSGPSLNGAVSIPFDRWRGPDDNPGQLQTEAELSGLIGAAGVRLNVPIVLIHQELDPMSAGRAAYVYWILKSLGARKVAVLTGGLDAWAEERLSLAERWASLPPYVARLEFDRTWYAEAQDIVDISQGRVAGTLVDSRPETLFLKKAAGELLASTLPSALNFSSPDIHATALQSDSPVVSVLDRLKGTDLGWKEGPVITFCDTGELAALNWFYASEVAGIEDVRLYPESVTGWLYRGNELAPAAEPSDGFAAIQDYAD